MSFQPDIPSQTDWEYKMTKQLQSLEAFCYNLTQVRVEIYIDRNKIYSYTDTFQHVYSSTISIHMKFDIRTVHHARE